MVELVLVVQLVVLESKEEQVSYSKYFSLLSFILKNALSSFLVCRQLDKIVIVLEDSEKLAIVKLTNYLINILNIKYKLIFSNNLETNMYRYLIIYESCNNK